MMEKMTEQEGGSLDIVSENLEVLKTSFPEAFTEDGVNFEVLRQLLGGAIDEGEEKYGLNWHGKKKARQIALTPSTGTLRPCKEESVDWESTQNLFIEGDNLEVLKLLQKSYAGKVKMIYIDPPYNTGKEFIYPDKFQDNLETYLKYTGQIDGDGIKLSSNTDASGRKHTNWLNMMYSRLKLSRLLLAEDGVAFISIDDNELTNLKLICDEIYGEENFISYLSVENNPKGRKNSNFVSVSNDYCVIYAKNKEKSSFVENIPKNIRDMKLDDNGNYVHASGKRVLVGENKFNKFVVNYESEKHYSVYHRDSDNSILFRREKLVGDIDNTLLGEGYKRYISQYEGEFVENTYTINKLTDLHKVGALEITDDKIFEKNFNSVIRIKSLLVNKSYEALINGNAKDYKLDVKTTSAGTALKEMFGTKEPIFTAPKNTGLIKLFITLFDSNDFIVMDFFCGSATTAHAVMATNAEDGGKRRYVMVQLPEVCDDKSEACKLGYKTISEIGKERIRRSAAKIRQENPGYIGDLGFKVYKLDSSNIRTWNPDRSNLEQTLRDHTEHLFEGRSEEDVLYELLLRRGVDLAVPIEHKAISGKTVYSIGYGVLFACLSKSINPDEVETLAQGIIDWHKEIEPSSDTQVVFRDSAFTDDIAKTNMTAILEQNGIAHVRSL
jgi:adenine-specific DNA-methyltransferase